MQSHSLLWFLGGDVLPFSIRILNGIHFVKTE
jgi:hypothetical protein